MRLGLAKTAPTTTRRAVPERTDGSRNSLVVTMRRLILNSSAITSRACHRCRDGVFDEVATVAIIY